MRNREIIYFGSPQAVSQLSVWDLQHLLVFSVRQIKLVKGLQPLQVSEKGTVTFEVEVSHEDVEGIWQKDGVRLKPSPNVNIAVLGKKHSLTLSSVTLEDAGLISFKADGIHSSGKLTVTGTQTQKSQALVGVGHACLLPTHRVSFWERHKLSF